MPDAASAPFLRRLILLVMAVQVLGLVPELLLMEHFESPVQWVPLGLLVLASAAIAAAYFFPSRRGLRAFRGIMLLLVLGGLLGVWEHLQSNVAFELERHPGLGGLALLWAALHKGVPVLAPGTLAQLGLLGLVFTFRHPALAAPPRA